MKYSAPTSKVNKNQKTPASSLLQKKSSFNKSPIQPSPIASQPNNSYEQQANSVANQLRRMPQQNFLQTKYIAANRLQRKPLSQMVTPFIQTKSDTVNNVGNNVSHFIQASKGKGSSIDSSTQSFMNSRFGKDFSTVKIHTDNGAILLSRSLNAKAFTVGSDIYFNQGQYQPASSEGKQLLAHELTHVVQQGAQPITIQRAEIDYRQLTWADFKAVPPKDIIYDAETFSDIRYPDLTTIKPQITNKATDQDCTRKAGTADAKDKQYEAKISMDSSGIKASAFMSQEKSWVKPLFKDPNEMKKFCTADQFTQSEIAKCKSTIQTATSARDTNCKTVNDSCADAVKNNQTFTVDIGDDHFEASTKDECAKVVSKCKELFGKSIKYTSGKGNDITTEAGCVTQLTNECLQGRQEAADALLSHEQGHFDITNVLAKKLETDIKSIVNSFAGKKISACGKDEAMKQATDISTKEVAPKIQDKIKDAQLKVDEIKGYYDAAKKVNVPGKLRSTQDLYDTETTHGSKEAEQAQWKTNIGKGNI